MRFRLMAVMALGLALTAPAQAEQKTDPFAQLEALMNSGVLFRGVIRDEDVTLLFDHIRAVLKASTEGGELPPPEALNQRAEEIAMELRARGSIAGMLLLNALETAARQALREAFPPPTPR